LTVQRYLAPSDFSVEEAWRLVDWCRQRGADEFTIDCLASEKGVEARVWRPFEKLVGAFSKGEMVRERMSGRTADELTRLSKVWELNATTIDALRRALPGGLLAYDPVEQGWFEDPVFYRDGRLMLGVLSHEAFAIMRLTEAESAELDAAGFPSHDSLPRVG
jgi:hypothetical protein